MYKTIYMRLSLLVVLLLSAALCHAENPARIVWQTYRFPQLPQVVQGAGLRNTAKVISGITKNPAAFSFADMRIQSMQDQLATLALFQAAHKKIADAVKADQTPLGAVNITSQPGTILFKDVPLAQLRPNEYIIMAVAYNAGGKEVSFLNSLEHNNQPITIQELDKALAAYDIHRIMIGIRQSEPMPGMVQRRIRIVDYNIDTHTITEITD